VTPVNAHIVLRTSKWLQRFANTVGVKSKLVDPPPKSDEKVWPHKGYDIKTIDGKLGIVGVDTGDSFGFVGEAKKYIDENLPDKS
jgi:hypothetical protein